MAEFSTFLAGHMNLFYLSSLVDQDKEGEIACSSSRSTLVFYLTVTVIVADWAVFPAVSVAIT